MDENEPVQENYRNFGLPLCLLSLAFFGFYVIMIIGILVLMLLSWLSGVFLTVPIGLLLLSLMGAVLIVREMKAQSLRWMAGIPLCVLLGIIIAGMVLFMSPGSGPVRFYPGIIAVTGFMCLPAGVAYLLGGLKGTEPAATRSFAKATGIFGVAISGLILVLVIITSWMSGLELVYLVILLFSLFHILILMPLLGDKMFRLGLCLSKIPSAEDVTGRAEEPVPRKKLSEIIRDIPGSLSSRTKRTLMALLILAVVVACCYMVWDITDTTPGRKWTEVTKSAPFGSRTGFNSAEYQGKLWIIGGSGNAGTDGDAWYTSDGLTWDRVSSADMVPQRLGASSAVFRDALWVIGGSDAQTYTPGNGIWYSGNGFNWSEIQPKTVFPARSWHSTVVFRDRIWVIGGNRGTIHDDLTNDVWYSDDGISWVQATPAAEFSPRSDHSSFVYQDKMWVIGGCDSTGYLNDVWYSGDGIHWTKAPASAPFATDTSFHAVVFDDRIWVLKTSYEQKADTLWGTETNQGIWYSYDGITWTQVRGTPEFFKGENNRGQPLPIVFDNRLFVLQQRGMNTGIWFTMPEGKSSCRPTANISTDKITGPVPLTVEFTDMSFCRPDQRQWDFGDGLQSTDQNPKHTFASPGNYSVTLMVKNDAGESRKSVDITVFKGLGLANPSAGKNWKLAVEKAAFGNRNDNTITVWNDSLWIIGGYQVGGLKKYNDTWYSFDGSNWTQATQGAGFEARYRHSAFVFHDKLWIIGGEVDYWNNTTGKYDVTLKNDVWYSTDGKTWTMVPPSANLPPLIYHSSIVFNDQIWVIGSGRIWASPDGIQWNRTDMPYFADNSGKSVVKNDDRVWVLHHGFNEEFWYTADGRTKTTAAVPPIDQQKYSVYSDSLTADNDRLWLCRILERRDEGVSGLGRLHGEVWSSEDGNNWALITDAVPFVKNDNSYEGFRIVAFDKKLWAFMVRSFKTTTGKWEMNEEIWYTDID